MKRNLHTFLLHLYYSSINQSYWADRMVDWDFNQVPATTILQQIYDDLADGKIELGGVELNEFQEMLICDPEEICGKRIKPVEGDL